MKYRIYVAGLFLASFLSGCYTMLSHPDIVKKDDNGYTYNEEVFFYDNCQSCHSEYDGKNLSPREKSMIVKAHEESSGSENPAETYSYSDNYLSGDGFYPGNYYGGYGYYYDYPWWYDVKPPEKYRNIEKESEGGSYSGSLRNNDSGRSSGTRTGSSGSSNTMDVPIATKRAGSSENKSSNDNSSVPKDNSTRSSSDSSTDRNSGSSSGTRNNDGGRSSGGRR